jgi:multidrug efflux pump subunit AcrA (membrane-fusion protein)
MSISQAQSALYTRWAGQLECGYLRRDRKGWSALALALGLFCVGLPAGAWAGDVPAGEAAPSAQPQAPEVTLTVAAQQNAGLETAHAQAGALTGTIDAMAMIQPEAGHLVRIHPAGAGKVLTVSVVPGQQVNAGDVLLTYQNNALHGVRLQMTKAQAALSTAQAALQNARATYERGARAGRRGRVGGGDAPPVCGPPRGGRRRAGPSG